MARAPGAAMDTSGRTHGQMKAVASFEPRLEAACDAVSLERRLHAIHVGGMHVEHAGLGRVGCREKRGIHTVASSHREERAFWFPIALGFGLQLVGDVALPSAIPIIWAAAIPLLPVFSMASA